MPHPDWKSLITRCYKSTEFMALATFGSKGLWVNPVYFAWDENFNLYFISQLDCTHMDNIASNADVSCTVFPTDRPEGQNLYGAYIKGTAHILEDDQDIVHADNIFYARVYPDNLKDKELDTYRNDPTWHFVKITLNGLWYFDTRYFEENRVEVPKEVWC